MGLLAHIVDRVEHGREDHDRDHHNGQDEGHPYQFADLFLGVALPQDLEHRNSCDADHHSDHANLGDEPTDTT